MQIDANTVIDNLCAQIAELTKQLAFANAQIRAMTGEDGSEEVTK